MGPALLAGPEDLNATNLRILIRALVRSSDPDHNVSLTVRDDIAELFEHGFVHGTGGFENIKVFQHDLAVEEIGRASCRERV